MEWCDLSIKVFLYVRFKSNNDCKVLSTVPGIQMVSVWCHICSSNHAVLEVERNKLFWDCLWRHPRERGHCQEDIKNYFFLPPRSNSILKKNVVLWYLATISHGSNIPIFQFFSHLHFTYTKLGYLKRIGFPSLRCGASEVFRSVGKCPVPTSELLGNKRWNMFAHPRLSNTSLYHWGKVPSLSLYFWNFMERIYKTAIIICSWFPPL